MHGLRDTRRPGVFAAGQLNDPRRPAPALVHDDLRHVQKHRRRYTRDGRGPAEQAEGAGHGFPRTRTSALWKRLGKPVYLWITRGLLRTRDGEERRPSSGPWPTWGPPLGRRDGAPRP